MRRLAILLLVLLLPTTAAEARRCDGIHGCRCGHVQADHFGLPRMYHGFNLWVAREWKKAFPRTTAHEGAVGYTPHGGRTGHVFRVVRVVDNTHAIVHDDKGTYERNIRGATFVDPHGFVEAHHKPTKVKRQHRDPPRTMVADRWESHYY